MNVCETQPAQTIYQYNNILQGWTWKLLVSLKAELSKDIRKHKVGEALVKNVEVYKKSIQNGSRVKTS